MNRLLYALFLMCVACGFVACTLGPRPYPGPAEQELKELPVPEVPEADRKKAVAAHTSFATSLYKQLKSESGNLFFSPYSISTALTMTYAGARTETAKEMRKALGLTLDGEALHKANAWLSVDLNNRGVKGPFKLRVVNRLWGQQGYPFATSFLALLGEQYRAGLANLRFSEDPDGARQTINRWVEEQTEKRIKDLLPKNAINESTRLVLTNAIYFKAPWADKFDKARTKKAPFKLSSDKQVQVDMMQASGANGSHADLETHELVVLPYKGASISMVILLPKAADGLQALEEKLTPAALEGWLQKAQWVMFSSLELPKFGVEQKLDLVPVLKQMGMSLPFTNDADFSGIVDASKSEEKLKIAAIVHKAFVQVDEEGTEAAAATGVVLGPTSAPPRVKVKIDRPFLFLVRDQMTGNILFMGRIVNPSKK